MGNKRLSIRNNLLIAILPSLGGFADEQFRLRAQTRGRQLGRRLGKQKLREVSWGRHTIALTSIRARRVNKISSWSVYRECSTNGQLLVQKLQKRALGKV